MRPFIILVCLILASCGNKKSSVEFGVMTKEELIVLKGEPLETKPISAPNGETLVYVGDEKYQVNDNKVTHRLRNPEGHEKTVLYWHHHFKDCPTDLKISPTDKNQHAPQSIQLSCAKEGTSVIYTKGASFIERVVEYAKE